ncbi:Uncharacterised protein [Actinobacillus equuli]|nr:Uncharacterised protein [Actinobacillus equuli]
MLNVQKIGKFDRLFAHLLINATISHLYLDLIQG